MGLFRNRHSKYEMLLTEHLDGHLDEAGQVTLDRHLETCGTCALELRELEAVTSLLRNEPLVEAPRSFALPYAPMQTAEEPGTGGWLRGMQVATATAAVVLVALVSLQVADIGSVEERSFSTADVTNRAAAPEAAGAQAAAPEMAAANYDSPTTIEPLPPEDADIPLATPAPLGTPAPSDKTALFGVVPPDDGQLTLDAADLPTQAPALNDELAKVGIGGGLELPLAPEPEKRTSMDWALVAMAIVTAALALGVVSLTWSSRRPRL